MKNTNKLLLSLLSVFPLLTATEPLPEPLAPPSPVPYHYEDVEVTTKNLGEEGRFRRYEIAIKNTGDKYVNVPEYIESKKDKEYKTATVSWPLFLDEVVPAGETKTYVYSTTAAAFDIASVNWYFTAYDLLAEEVALSNCSFEYDGDYLWLKGLSSGIGDYVYIATLEVTYDGVKYAFNTREFLKPEGNKNEVLKLATVETAHFGDGSGKLDLSKLSVNKTTVYRSVEKRLDSGFHYPEWLWYVCIVIVVVIFLIVIHRYRKTRE